MEKATFGGPGLYLPWGFDTFPQAEVEDEEHHHQTHSQLPAGQAKVLDTPTLMEMQHTPSAERQNTHKTEKCIIISRGYIFIRIHCC